MRTSVSATVVLLAVVAALGPATPQVGEPGSESPAARGATPAGGSLTTPTGPGLGATGVAIRGGPSTGESVATGDVNGDGVTDVLVGVPFDDGGGSNAGAAYLFLGPVTGDRRLPDADATLVGAAPGDWAGFAVAVVDADGDGRGEAVVGAPLRNGGAGAVYVVDSPSGTVALDAARVVSGPDDARFGRAVAGAGDLAGGPGTEILAGAPAAAEGAGAAYLLSERTFDAGAVAAAAATYRGVRAGDRAGWAVAAGDVDDDGRPEVVVGAREAADGAGAVYVLGDGSGNGSTGRDAQATSLADAATVVAGPAGASAGWSVATGDVSGDGVADVVVGAPEAGAGGAAYVVPGGDLPTRVPLANETPLLAGRGAGDRAGWAVAAGAGDCEGAADVLVGAPHADGGGPDAGAVYRVAPDGSVTTTYAGERAGDYAGYRLAAGGDATGDGRADLAVGAPGNESSAATGGEAAAYVVAGDCPVADPPGAGSTPATGDAPPTPTRTVGGTTTAGVPATDTDGPSRRTGPPGRVATTTTPNPAAPVGPPGAGAPVAAAALAVAAALLARRHG